MALLTVLGTLAPLVSLLTLLTIALLLAVDFDLSACHIEGFPCSYCIFHFQRSPAWTLFYGAHIVEVSAQSDAYEAEGKLVYLDIVYLCLILGTYLLPLETID